MPQPFGAKEKKGSSGEQEVLTLASKDHTQQEARPGYEEHGEMDKLVLDSWERFSSIENLSEVL